MRALDPRLLVYARATRTYLVRAIALGISTGALVVLQAWLIAVVVSGAFVEHKALDHLRGPLAALLVVVLLRAGVVWRSEVTASKAAAAAKSQLRAAMVERAATGSPVTKTGRSGALIVLMTRGIDALDSYFSKYLPQVILAVIVPLTVLGVVAGRDWVSAILIAITLPLVPVFMALIGMATRDRSESQLNALERLASHFLDVVAGLTTLKVFGRAKAQIEAISQVTERYRTATMQTLRVTFLSSLVLELIAMISVALVAVAVGLRLVGGTLSLRTALFVLVLTPEAYLPLRLLGANFHASAEGVAAAAHVFEVLESPLPPKGVRTDLGDVARSPITLRDLRVSYPQRDTPALDRLSLTIEPGETLAITGPSGCGKSTLLNVLLGFLTPDRGSVAVGGIGLDELDPDLWRSQIAWVPQRPHLFAASIEANVRLGHPHATRREIENSIEAAGLDSTVSDLPLGVRTLLGERGVGFSAGERQRVALARAFLRDSPILLLDEPTANLDGRTEDRLVESIRGLSADKTVVIVAHRPALMSLADRVLDLPAARVLP